MTNDKDGAALLREACAKVAQDRVQHLHGSDLAHEQHRAREARLIADAIRALPIPEAPTSVEPVADDVRRLVIAAREAWEVMGDCSADASYADDLDKALEAFSSRVLYENEPDTIGSHFGNGGGLDPVRSFHVEDCEASPGFGGGDLRQALRAAIEWIDAIPPEIVASLPVMPGFDRDWLDEIAALKSHGQAFDAAGVREALVDQGYENGYDWYRNKWIGDHEEMIADLVCQFVPRALPIPEAPASVEPVAAQNDWDKGAQALIKEAAALVQPSEGEAVFYIRVGGEHTSMNVKTKGQVDPDTALKNAIGALNGERSALSNCPVHNNPNGSHDHRGRAGE